jgi:hypothetical protein
MDFTTLHHLEIKTKDVNGGKIPLDCYTNGRGSELAPAQVRSGYIVAIQMQNVLYLYLGPIEEEMAQRKYTYP